MTHSVLLLYQKRRGKDAINMPAAGMGKPLNPTCNVVSKLYLARRNAPAQGKIKAGMKNKNEVERPPSFCAKDIRKNSNTIIAGATPKLTTSASESNCFPISDEACINRAIKPSRKSMRAAIPMNKEAIQIF